MSHRCSVASDVASRVLCALLCVHCGLTDRTASLAFPCAQLPDAVVAIAGQATVPFGMGAIQTPDATIAAETCEELFTPNSPHIGLALDGVEIISNGSGAST